MTHIIPNSYRKNIKETPSTSMINTTIKQTYNAVNKYKPLSKLADCREYLTPQNIDHKHPIRVLFIFTL